MGSRMHRWEKCGVQPSMRMQLKVQKNEKMSLPFTERHWLSLRELSAVHRL